MLEIGTSATTTAMSSSSSLHSACANETAERIAASPSDSSTGVITVLSRRASATR